jgi:hypothetical protein
MMGLGLYKVFGDVGFANKVTFARKVFHLLLK